MKKWGKLIIAIVAALVALAIGAVALLQVPRVQKAICDKITGIVSEKTGLELEIGDIHFALFDRVIAGDISLKEGGKTILTCEKAAVSISPLSILKGNYKINRLSLDNGEFYPSNLPAMDKDDSADKPFSLPDLKASIGHLKVSDFKVVNYNPYGEHVNRKKEPRKIDFNDINVTDLDIDLKDVLYDGKSASLEILNISFKEQVSGMELKNLSLRAQYDDKGLHVSDLNFKDNVSDIKLPGANLYFDSFDDFQCLADSVRIDASLNQAHFNLGSLHYFLDDISYINLDLIIDGKVSGTLSDIRTESLKVWSGSRESFLDLSAHLVGLPDARNTMATIMVNNSRTNMRDIAEIVAQCTPEGSFNKSDINRLAPGTQLSFEGSLNGFFEDFVAYGEVKSNLGGCKVDIICRSDWPAGYEVLGFADLNEFDLGRFLQVDNMGKVTCHASASGMFAPTKENTEYYIDEIAIPKFEFNGYAYSNISAAGNWKYNEFEARLVSADPNLKFMLQGILAPSSTSGSDLFHLKLSLGHADLAALNFDKRDISNVRLNAEADITRTKDGRLMGKIDVTDIQCKSPDGTFDLDDIEVVTINGKERYLLAVNSNMLRARYRGSAFVTSIIPQVEGLVMLGKLDNVAARMKNKPELGSDRYDLSLKVLDASRLLGYLAPGTHIHNGTSVTLRSPGDSTGTVKLQSPLVAVNNIYVQDLQGSLNFLKESSAADIKTQMIRVGDVTLGDSRLKGSCRDNGITADFAFCNDPDSLDAGHLKAHLAFPDLTASSQNMLVYLGTSFLRTGGEQWNIDPSSVFLADKHITVNDVSIYNHDQGIYANGVLSGSNRDTCSFDIRDLDLSLANLLMKNPLNISGTLNGNGKVISVFSQPDVFADVAIDSLYLAGEQIGRIEARSNWDDTLHRVNLNAVNILEGRQVLTANGFYNPASGKVDASVAARDFPLNIAEPFISSLATDVSGHLTGDISITGPLNNPDVVMKRGHVEAFRARLDYTQVPYTLDGYVDIDSKKILLSDFTLKDDEHGSGNITGVITHDHFNDLFLDIKIRAHEVLGFNTTYNQNETFYGKAYASGSINIGGPLNALALNLDVVTQRGTEVSIPIKSSAATHSSILTFIDSSAPKKRVSALDSLLNLHRVKIDTDNSTQQGALSVFARVRATDNARLNLEIDSDNNDALRVNGNGIVDLTVKDGNFSILGDYTVSEGEYSLALLGLVTRDFTLDRGSTIHFTGDIMQSELDMTAAYKTKASITPLIANNGESSLRRPVNCGIRITDKLSNPSLSFTIRIDDLDPTVEALIEGTLNTEEKRMRQFLALLISGSFIPDEQSGIVNNTSVSYFNATEIMSNQLNSILSQLGIPIDLGFNYQPTETGQDIFDVAISTQLMNNRVSVNGNIGNRRYLTSNRDDIVGDIDVDIKLGRRDKTRLKLFSHSADEYSNYLDQTQRNGIGISYKEEFNSFRDIFRKKRSPRGKEKGDAPHRTPPSKGDSSE